MDKDLKPMDDAISALLKAGWPSSAVVAYVRGWATAFEREQAAKGLGR